MMMTSPGLATELMGSHRLAETRRVSTGSSPDPGTSRVGVQGMMTRTMTMLVPCQMTMMTAMDVAADSAETPPP